MRRAVLVLAGLALLATAVWAAGPWLAQGARFGAEDCRRLALEDAATGRALVGIEDIAPYGDLLFLSVQNRLAAETAAAEGRAAPAGGIYRLRPGDLAADGPVRLANETAGGGTRFHPHGIHASLAKLVAVERHYGPAGAEGTGLRIFAIREDGLEPLRRVPHPGLCAANDLELRGTHALVTLDREDCPGVSLAEALWPSGSGRVVRVGTGDADVSRLGAVAEGLVHANGLAQVDWGSTDTLVAETRAGRVAVLGGGRLEVPGAPDNLVPDGAGGVVAALHPSLLRLALYRYGWTGSAPTRIVRIERGGQVEMLVDDPSGRLLSAATAGVLLPDGRLVAGSVRDAGLLVCGG